MRTYSVIVVNPLEKCSGDDKPAGMLFQYDYGQKIAIGGVTLPAAYEVHFSNQKLGKSVTVIGDVTGIVDIPDALLLTGQDVHVWLYLHQGEDDGETVYYARIAVNGRAKPTHETPTPVQQDEITQAIAALNAAVEATEADASAAEASAEDAGRAQAAAEAAQDRAEAAQGAAESAQTGAETAQDKAEDAQEAAEGARDRAETAAAFLEDCSAEAETLTAGSDATASYSEGVFHFGIPRGQKGSKGDPGDRGPEGPTGPEGPEGPAGYSPTASVSKSGSTATISITDKTGTTTATVSDGEDGAPGQDGYTPVRGTDYWTAEDQAAIVADVEADLIDDTAGAGDTTNVWSADKSSGVASGLLSAIDRKAPCIYQDASGDIVSFTDGADNMPLSSCVVQIDPVQSGTGDPSPTNVRPITGHTGAQVSRTGRNLLNKAAGVPYDVPRFIKFGVNQYSDTVPNKTIKLAAGTYTFSVSGANSTNYESFAIFDESNTRVVISYNATGITFTLSKTGFYYITLVVTAENFTTWDNYDLMLESGSTATPYTPYVGTTYPISWQTAAGTVYGGFVDPVKGELTVDMAYLNAVNATWYDAGSGKVYTSLPLSPTELTTILCSHCEYHRRPAAGTYTDYVDWGGYPNSNRNLIVTMAGITDTLSAWNTYIQSNDVEFVYYLETPIVYDLTDLPTITALKESNIWADTGAISLTYPADTRTYVDSAITAATDPDGNVVTVSGSTPSITGESGKRYICGTVDSISITPPQTGIIDVVFTSGTTPTVLTVPNTVLFPAWFNPASLDASTKYEINIMDGTDGAVMAWT